MAETELNSLISHEAEMDYFGGSIQFFECVGTHNISNALRWFKSQKIIIDQTINIGKSNQLLIQKNKTVKVLQLHPDFRNMQSLIELSDSIAIYKKNAVRHKNNNTVLRQTNANSNIIQKKTNLKINPKL